MSLTWWNSSSQQSFGRPGLTVGMRPVFTPWHRHQPPPTLPSGGAIGKRPGMPIAVYPFQNPLYP
jgi:hypothetical protein